ncbi:phospho-N-acetylmuramoyl-pentapeptide-transferase [Clostridiaceae bacterium HSG29]|nr:phospho-N-acetylmuramoyl-pentapeptide-transferase [Clostridiaceae bacterium HSG29]
MGNQLNIYTAFFLSLIITLSIGKILIKKLTILKYGQSIRKEGPESHFKKTGTPTMGGVIFLITFLFIIIINGNFTNSVLIILLSTYGLAAIGFIDDYRIIKLKTNEGISAKQKILGQFIIALIVSVMGYYFLGSDIFIPFLNKYIELKWIYYPFNIFFIVALSNSVNLTDGIDGLSTTVTIIVLGFFLITSIIFRKYCLSILIIAAIGALFGFLFYNINPAKVFMGDVGSLSLGGLVASIAMVLKLQLIVPIIGIIYFIETVSVIIQVFYFKKFGKRVFKMTPIHHHYELSGLSENQIVKKFALITILGFICSMLILFL